MLHILFSGTHEQWISYHPFLKVAFETQGLSTSLTFAQDENNLPYPAAQADYIIASPAGAITDFSVFTSVKAVFSLWAGVDALVANATLTQPLARMVDEGLTQGMVEWVCGHSLRHHLSLDRYIFNPDHLWDPKIPPLAQDRTIGILGLGALGSACAHQLKHLGFNVTGWSRNPKTLDGINCLSGQRGLSRTLSTSEILVLLLPLTQQTHHIINAQTLALMPQNTTLLNPGRGPLIDDTALLAALDNNHISHATLDVFNQEPLPQSHPYWQHPNVTVTPHCASETRPKSASMTIAKNLKGFVSGAPLHYTVDSTVGY